MINNPQNYIDPSGYFWDWFSNFFSGIGSFFSSWSSPSVNTAVANNNFMQGLGFCSTCGWQSGGAVTMELQKYSSSIVEWDGVISGPAGKYSIFDGTTYEAGLGSPWFGNLDDFIPQKLPLKGISLAGGGIVAGIGRIGGEVAENSGIRLARKLGSAGEKLSGIVGPRTAIDSLTNTAVRRVPDQLTKYCLLECKNVIKLRWTNQLTDFGEFTLLNPNMQFIIHVRQGTEITKRAAEMIQKYGVHVIEKYPRLR